MFGRTLKSRVILVSALGVAAYGLSIMLADAGGDTAATFEPAVDSATVLPVASLDPVATPSPVSMLSPVAVTPTPTRVALVPSSSDGNPFAVTAPIVTGRPSSSATSSSNPFTQVLAKPQASTSSAPFTLNGTGSEPAGPASIEDQPDVTALRYYAAQRDMERVGAETRRLQSLYPNFEVPADLFVEVSNVDEQPLWDLFAVGDYAGERARIEEFKAANPGWTPSTDLMTKLEDAEARSAMKAAYALGNWNQVITIATERSSLLVCAQIDALWELGEALAKTSDYARAFDTYKYVLKNCEGDDLRLSTVQKASLLLPSVGTEGLVMLGRPMPDGTSEFISVGFDDLRRRIASNVNDRFEADPVMPDELDRFVQYVELSRNPDDIGLIAWYYYSQKEWDSARDWFSMGNKVKRDPKFLEGEILAMRAKGASLDALEIAMEVRERSPELNQQYIELVAEILSDPYTSLRFPKRDLKDYEQVVIESRSALGAQAVGWRYVEDDSLSRATDWFERSMEWEVTEGGVIGLAVVASRLKHYKTLQSLKTTYGDEYAELADFTVYSTKARQERSVTVRSSKPASGQCEQNSRGLLALFICGRG